tara:strand:- start:176 stop:451 length:276 start_codon:yes stop_codon:yes gene_type:complete
MTSKQEALHKIVDTIMQEEILPRIAKLGVVDEEESFTQAIALSNAYINAACILMCELGIEKTFTKTSMSAAVDVIWLQHAVETPANLVRIH